MEVCVLLLNFKKRFYILLSVFLFSTVPLFACQQVEESTPRSLEPTVEQTRDQRMGDEQPQLEGGSEKDVREPRPVSNDKLQKKYPNILALHGPPTENKVALTFDDGPDTHFTPQVLDMLKKHNVKATFFLIGARVKEHDEIVKRIHDEGHVIGNHTYWHPNLPKEELDRMDWEVTETENVIEDITGYKPRLFRSPYGALNEEMVETLGEMNNTIIGWNVDSLDWKQLGADVIADNVLSNVDLGSIILMHDGGDWSMDLTGTVEGLDKIISKLKEDNTNFVTVPELIGVPKEKPKQ